MAARNWRREPMVWFVIALPLLTVVAGIATAVIAAQGPAEARTGTAPHSVSVVAACAEVGCAPGGSAPWRASRSSKVLSSPMRTR